MTDNISQKEGASNQEGQKQEGQNFTIQRIFLKDVSFESPNAPSMFQKDWQPDVNLDLDTQSREIGENVYEVILRLTVTDADGGAALRTELRPLLQKRMRKLIALHHTLLPASLAAWTLFGANLWAYPGTLVGQEKARQYGELEAGS